MDITRAVKRLIWRMKHESAFKPNDLDVDAAKEVSDWITRSKIKGLDENKKLYRLYVAYFTELVAIYGGNLREAQKHLHKKLEMDEDESVEVFTELLNQRLLYEAYEFIGIDMKKHPSLKSDQETAADKALIKEHDDMLVKVAKGKWSTAQVKISLVNQFTEMLNKF